MFDLKFGAKLDELGVTAQFEANLEQHAKNVGRSIRNRIEEINREDEFRYFIGGAFIWTETPEGHKFWEHISNQ